MKVPSRAIKLCGTEQPDIVGRILRAGPMQVEFDNGQLRYLKMNGVEVLRAVGFLVRDENWGTYTPVISGLEIESLCADLTTFAPGRRPSRPWRELQRGACGSSAREDRRPPSSQGRHTQGEMRGKRGRVSACHRGGRPHACVGLKHASLEALLSHFCTQHLCGCSGRAVEKGIASIRRVL